MIFRVISMIVMQVLSHPAELCPSHESKYRPISVNWYEKVESLAAKYGIGTVYPGHADTPPVGMEPAKVSGTRPQAAPGNRP